MILVFLLLLVASCSSSTPNESLGSSSDYSGTYDSDGNFWYDVPVVEDGKTYIGRGVSEWGPGRYDENGILWFDEPIVEDYYVGDCMFISEVEFVACGTTEWGEGRFTANGTFLFTNDEYVLIERDEYIDSVVGYGPDGDPVVLGTTRKEYDSKPRPTNPGIMVDTLTPSSFTKEEFDAWCEKNPEMLPENYIAPEKIAAELSLGGVTRVEPGYRDGKMFRKFTYYFSSETYGNVGIAVHYLPEGSGALTTFYENGTIESGGSRIDPIVLQYGCPESLFVNGYDVRTIVSSSSANTKYMCFERDVIFTYRGENIYRMHFRCGNVSFEIYPDSAKQDAFYAQESIEPLLSYLTVVEFSRGFADRVRAAE
ncbi:MAG: hypothetical protein E7618_04135 [Ruminococcaceae bacterium]|nr:hypothetical protein [Oscillospiraceae bacterium]